MSTSPRAVLSQRAILWFWLPLAFSWLLMTFEGPWIQGVIARKPDAELQLAAFGLIFSLSITIEAPIIMLLATSASLSRDGQAYRILWWFTTALNIGVTVLAALMAFTPLLDAYLGGLLGIPQNIIEATRPGMAIMVPWSAMIGYRRFLQGILIRNNHTGLIGQATVIRIIISAGVAVGLGALTDIPGATIGAWSLIASVAAEALYIYRVSRPDVAALHQIPAAKKPLDYSTVLRFHLPLAVTSLLTLLVRPVIESGLADTPDAEIALAAWPVIFSIMLLMRSGGMAWQEVVIALSKGPSELRALRRFTLGMGLLISGAMCLLAFTPLIDFYIGTLLEIPPSIRDLVIVGTQLGILLPLLTTLQSYQRAVLMRANSTSPIYQGMAMSFIATAALMLGGVALDLPGIPLASLSLTIGLLLELGFLQWAVWRNNGRLETVWQTILSSGD